MADTLKKQFSPEEIYDWLREEAKARHMDARVHSHLAKQVGKWLHVPVYIAGDQDAFEFASALQDLEDAWNNQDPKPDWSLWLIPAAK